MDIVTLSDWLVKGALLSPQLVAQVVGFEGEMESVDLLFSRVGK